MSFFSRKPAGPRAVRCPHCATGFEVGPTVQSLVCRVCNTSVKIADHSVSQYSATVTLETAGNVVIEKKGALVVQQRIAAMNLTVHGSLKGNAVICEATHIVAGGQLQGELSTRSLQIDAGGIMRGILRIDPALTPEERLKKTTRHGTALV